MAGHRNLDLAANDHTGFFAFVPTEYIGPTMKLCQDRRGILQGTEYLSPTRAMLRYDLPLAEVAPAWMLATAREAWLVNPPDDSNVSDWIQAVWFARETGLDKEAEQLSETLTPLSEEFAARWKRLDGLP